MATRLGTSAGAGGVTRRASTLAELEALIDLADESACLDYLRDLLFPAGTACPKCTRPSRFHRVSGRSAYSCQYCGYHVYPTAGTIFRRSTTDLCSWFRAIQLVSSRRDAVTARELELELGVTRKTASRMLRRILPVVDAGPELLLETPAASPAPSAAATERSPTAGTRVEPTLDEASQRGSSNPLRDELLASLTGLRDDLRAAERKADDARQEVEVLREAVHNVERLTAADSTG